MILGVVGWRERLATGEDDGEMVETVVKSLGAEADGSRYADT